MLAQAPAIRDESASKTGQIIGNVAQTVFFDDKPLALEGSINASGASIQRPPINRNVYVEDKVMAVEGDLLSDGSILLERKK